ncbi:MAG TPA: TonB-dependent receptor, partial [Flavobacteriia bacterium]|nr:TonB-dependent receptor [Flavobacteriia bacterium]
QTNKNDGKEVLIPDAKTNDFGVYGLSNFKVHAFTFQAGIRFDNRKIDSKLTGTIPALKKNYQGLTFSAGTVYTKENNKIRANISNGFRAPNTSELLSDGVHEGTNRYEIGNPNLKNESATQLDVSYDYQSEHFQFSVNPFYNYIKDYVYLTPTNQLIDNTPVYKYLQKDAFLYGGEMGIHYHPHPIDWLHFATTFATVFAEDTNKNPLPLIPQSKLNNSISADFKSDKKIFVQKIFLQDIYKFKQPKIGQFETESKAYNLVNLGMSVKIKAKSNPINIDLGVKNMFNTKYIDHLSRFKDLGIPNPGRNYYISLKMNFVNKINAKK